MSKTSNQPLTILMVIGELLFLYGFLGWTYGALIQVTHPEWLPLGLSHLTPWIRLDTFAILSFLTSAAGFLIWRLTKELSAKS